MGKKIKGKEDNSRLIVLFIILLIITFILFIVYKNNKEEINTISVKNEKQDFYVEIKKISNFGSGTNLEKTGKISSNQNIKLSSQVSGRVAKIYVKEGDYVNSGDIIARLDDNISNYGLTLKRLQNALDKAKISYETNENRLDKNIFDIKTNLANLKLDEYNSKSSLELEKIDNSVKNLILDYENLKTSNLVTIDGFKNSMGKDLLSLTTFMDDLIDFSDRLLGVTSKNEDLNDSFENYLGAKDSKQKKLTEGYLKELVNIRNNDIVNIKFEFNSNFDSNMEKISNIYIKINLLLRNLDIILDNSIVNASSFTESTISGYKTNINGFWTNYNVNNGGYIILKNSINSFLDTYENNEVSVLKQIELLEADKNIYIKGLDIKLELDESTLEEAISNKSLTLRELDTYIIDAEISYKQALNNFNKLTIKSPISGIIGKVLIDVGQEVGISSQLFEISNNGNNEITVSFSKNELNFINIGDIALVDFDDSTYTGSIYSISNIADENLKYTSRISFSEGVNLIGNIVTVEIPFNTNKRLLPINMIKINNSGIGTINILEDGKIKQLDIELGEIYGSKIEIINELNPELLIITNYVDNFDMDKFELRVRE